MIIQSIKAKEIFYGMSFIDFFFSSFPSNIYFFFEKTFLNPSMVFITLLITILIKTEKKTQ